MKGKINEKIGGGGCAFQNEQQIQKGSFASSAPLEITTSPQHRMYCINNSISIDYTRTELHIQNH